MWYLVVLEGVLEWLGNELKFVIPAVWKEETRYEDRRYSLKQYNTVEYLRCYLNSDLNGEPMARRVLNKINTKLSLL